MKEEILKDKRVNVDKLLEYGFVKKGEVYHFSTYILDKQFELRLQIASDGTIKTQTIEVSSQDEYVLHLTNASGEFVGNVRKEYEEVLLDVTNKCFEKHIFKSKQALEIIDYINKVYGDELEYLWQKFPNNAIWRRKDNRKWYGALLTVSKRKLKINSDEVVEIIDLRADSSKIGELIDNKTIYEGYHMNKKHWISIILNGSMPTKEILRHIDDSYRLADK